MRLIGVKEIEDMAIGAALLGAGGGGDPYIGKLMAISAVEKYGPIKLITPDEVADDELVVPTAMMGAPTVLAEKIPSGREAIEAFKTLEKMLGKKITATMPIEAGGVNSMIPLALAAELGLPVVDGDGMGRAFPELQMVTFYLNDVSATPIALTDEKGNSIVLETVGGLFTEKIARAATGVLGGSLMLSIYPMTGKQLKQSVIYDSLSIEEKIGQIIHEGRQKNFNPLDNLLAELKGFKLFEGKITDVLRTTDGGFVRGTVKFEGIDGDAGSEAVVNFQNENLMITVDGKVRTTTPDLISILDYETSMPYTTEGLQYGSRCRIIALPADKQWRTKRGLEVVGPRYFGYDVDYVPLEELMEEVDND